MQEIEVELLVGEVIQIGTHTIAVVELHDDEVTLKICDASHDGESERPLWPR